MSKTMIKDKNKKKLFIQFDQTSLLCSIEHLCDSLYYKNGYKRLQKSHKENSHSNSKKKTIFYT